MEEQLDKLEQLVQKRAAKASKHGKTIRNRPEIKEDRFKIPEGFSGLRLKVLFPSNLVSY